MVKTLEFMTLQEAWEGINDYMIRQSTDFLDNGGMVYGTELIAYRTMISVNKCWVDPEFDFGIVLGYHMKKWTTLVKNYVDFNYLELLKSEINRRELSRSRSYNYAFHFSNKYGGGKDCLLSLVFSRRKDEQYPTVFFNVRVSEVTSRLLFDFLLVQRICEYVYGKDFPVQLEFYAPSMYVTAERFTLFAHYKGGKSYIKTLPQTNKFQVRVKDTFDKFSNIDHESIKYKAHKRCAAQIQKDEEGKSLGRNTSLKAKDLILVKQIKELPEDVITQKDIIKFLKKSA